MITFALAWWSVFTALTGVASSLGSMVAVRFLFGVGGTGSELGRLARPHGMVFDREGYLYIADAGNERIQKFELPRR